MRRALGCLGVLLLVVALAVGGVLLGDGQIRRYVEGEVAAGLQREAGLAERPEVTLDGTPFAWHLLRRDFPSGRVRVDAASTTVEGHAIELSEIDAGLGRITVEGPTARIDSVLASGRLSYADLSELAGMTLAHDRDDRIAATFTETVLGLQVTATVTGVPDVSVPDQSVTLAEPQVSVAGIDLGPEVSQQLVQRVATAVKVPLPAGLQLRGLAADARGVVVMASGRDVQVPLAQ